LRLDVPETDDWTFTNQFETEHQTGASRTAIIDTCMNLLTQNQHLLMESPRYSEDQKTEIAEKMRDFDVKDAAVRYMKGESQLNYYKKVLTAYSKGSATGENVSDCLPFNFIVTYRGYKGARSNPRHLYVVFYTKATRGASQVLSAELSARIPHTNGRSIFSIRTLETRAEVVAGSVIGFDATMTSTPEKMKTALRDYLQIYKMGNSLTVSRCIQSNQERFAMSKEAFHYVNAKKNDVEIICAELSVEFDLKLKVTYARSGAELFNVKKIEW
jgi:hypothetical protein